MPLRNNTLYTVHNDLTHTVLDMSEEPHVARGWGWHGKPNQQWKLIQGDNVNEWKLQNQRQLAPHARYLSRVANHVNRRLIGEVAEADATFVIQLVPGTSESYRIKFGTSAVTLVTGVGVDNVVHVVHDLQADGPPIVLRAVADASAASIWSFRPVAKLPLADGTYQIFNNRTRTVLGVAGNAPDFNPDHPLNAIQGQQSQADQPNQRWIVTKDSASDSYTFKNSREDGIDHYLGTAIDPPPPGPLRALGDGNKRKFTIRKVPDTNYYKIFLAPVNDNGFSVLAVNLGNPIDQVYPVNLQNAEAETWSFN